jgi:hypothetical protein
MLFTDGSPANNTHLSRFTTNLGLTHMRSSFDFFLVVLMGWLLSSHLQSQYEPFLFVKAGDMLYFFVLYDGTSFQEINV